MKHALIIPVYRNESSLSDLLEAISGIAKATPDEFECVFVVDGSPDDCWSLLDAQLPRVGFRSRLLLLSRNFGSFAAIRAGLQAVDADYYAMMAADLQEPPGLVLRFFEILRSGNSDVVIGCRDSRDDPWPSKLSANLFWSFYRRLVQPDMPIGGFDLFGCSKKFRNHLLALTEVRSALVGQVLWLGFRRQEVGYQRLGRKHGKSAWTLKKKISYLQDSIFAFTDLPIRLLLGVGLFGTFMSALLGFIVLSARISGAIVVPGYAATVLAILFFAALNIFGLGIVGSYAWRAYENSKHRPESVVFNERVFGSEKDA